MLRIRKRDETILGFDDTGSVTTCFKKSGRVTWRFSFLPFWKGLTAVFHFVGYEGVAIRSSLLAVFKRLNKKTYFIYF